MISAFGVDHGGEVSKGFGGVLSRMGAKAANKSGAAMEAHGAGTENLHSFNTGGNALKPSGSEALRSKLSQARTPKKGVSGMLMRRSKSFQAGYGSQLGSSQFSGSHPPGKLPKFLQGA